MRANIWKFVPYTFLFVIAIIVRKHGQKGVVMSDVDFHENSIEDIINKYKEPVSQMAAYLPWLSQNIDQSVANDYGGAQMEHTIPFPVYDSNLLSFVKTAMATGKMDRNYVYVYRRNGLETCKDELSFIEKAQIMQMEDLMGIISKYVLEGNTKGRVWAEGVRNGVIHATIVKMRELINYWSGT